LTSGSWLVPVTGLRRTTGSQRHEQRAGSLGELRVADSIVEPGTDVEVDVVLTSIDGGVEVAGTVRSLWTAECRRCLRPVHGEVVAEVREIYRPVAPTPVAPGRRSSGVPAKGGSGVVAKGGSGVVAKGVVPKGGPWSGETNPSDDADEETYPLGADHLDLVPLARDAILLNLPLAPLCREDCVGLCPICGADLADGDCGCEEDSGDPRWAALDALRDLGGADAGSTA
jgi:uncharacterized protein